MLANIQLLRAVAALAVVWRHMLIWFEADPGPVLLHAGRAGVDVFFVISGFIMLHTTRNDDRSPGEFWLDRLIRIAPPYWLMTLLVAALFFAGLPASDVAKMDANDLALNFAFIPNLRADGDTNPILNVGWTLIYEMYFYALFGLAFFLRSQVKALALLTVFFLATYLAVRFIPDTGFTLYRWTRPITLEFAAGGLLALLYRRPLNLSLPTARLTGWLLVAIGLAGICVAAWITTDSTLEPTGPRTVAFGVPAFLLVGGALMLEKAGIATTNRAALFLGAASYSIYLAHPLVLQYVSLAWPEGGFTTIAVGCGVAFLAATLAGCVMHVAIEKPVERFLKSLLRRPARRAALA